MKKDYSFADVLESADKLSLDEQETMIDILYRRMVARRRKELTGEVQAAQREFQEGLCRPVAPEDIIKEILL